MFKFENDTWIEPECDGSRRARVLFPDKRLRIIRCAGVADTYFSIAAYSYKGLRGFIIAEDGTLIFVPYTNQVG
jgi:hypothetical protein